MADSGVADSLAGTIVRQYDDFNRLTEEQTPQGAVTYTYDNAGRRLTMSVPGQSQTSYAWDNANRLTGITQGGATVSLAYDNANRRTQLSLPLTSPNSIVAAYSYDGDSHVTGMTWSIGTTQLGNLTYGYDADGRVTVKGGSFAQVNLPTAATGNTFNVDNAMTAFNGTSLSYDGNGNLTSDGTNTYTWDARNDLVAISGAVSASFVYDAFGRRVSKTINGETTDYLYDGANPVQELTPEGGQLVPTANMLTGLGTDEFYQLTDSIDGTVDYLTDAVGSTLALTDGNGNITTQYTYDPFGNVTVSNASSANPFQFTGRENDGTGLYYYRARYYSPALQRFISEDPISQEPSYVYVGNSPIGSLDPTGAIDVNPSSFLNALGNIIYNETKPIDASQPGIFTGRTFVGIALTNGFLAYSKKMCVETPKYKYVALPNGGCYLRKETIYWDRLEESRAAAKLAVVSAFTFFDLMGAYQYRIWGRPNGGIHLGPLSFGGVPFAVAGPYNKADYGVPWWFVFYTDNPGERYRFLGPGWGLFGPMLPIDYSDTSE